MMHKIIAGPCQHESLDISIKIAEKCKKICDKYKFDYYFKASFDKANRTHLNSKRGLGLKKTLEDFAVLKKQISNIKILTDVHKETEVELIVKKYYDIIDVIQIPAMLCRQTDLIVSACNTGKIINIKKGQFISPWEVSGILSKTKNCNEVWITERGTCFGYNNIVVDFTGIQYMIDEFDANIVFDVTHSLQKPGSLGTSSGGNRKYISGLSRAASAMGIKSFFMEVHPNPDNSPSDGENSLHLEDFEEVIDGIYRYSYTSKI